MIVLRPRSPKAHANDRPSYSVIDGEQATDPKTVEPANEAALRRGAAGPETITPADLHKCDWVRMLEQWRESEARA